MASFPAFIVQRSVVKYYIAANILNAHYRPIAVLRDSPLQGSEISVLSLPRKKRFFAQIQEQYRYPQFGPPY